MHNHLGSASPELWRVYNVIWKECNMRSGDQQVLKALLCNSVSQGWKKMINGKLFTCIHQKWIKRDSQVNGTPIKTYQKDVARPMCSVPNSNPCLWLIKSQVSAREGAMKSNLISICKSYKLIQELKMSGWIATVSSDRYKFLPWPYDDWTFETKPVHWKDNRV